MIKTKTVKVIDFRDWDNLIKETYGKIYSFQQQDGCKGRETFDFSVPVNRYELEEQEDYMNESIEEKVNGKIMGIRFEKWLKRDVDETLKDEADGDQKFMINLFWERNFYPSVLTVIDDLYKKRLIEDGEYLINIDW